MPAVPVFRDLKQPTPGQGPFVSYSEKSIDPTAQYPLIRAGFDNLGILQYYELQELTAYLATSAGVGNRTIQILITKYQPREPDPSQIWIGTYDSGNIAASQTGRITISPIGTLLTATLIDSVNVFGAIEMTRPIVLCGYDRVTVSISNPLAGDLMQVAASFKYLNHIYGIKEL